MHKSVLLCLLTLGSFVPITKAADPALTIYNANFAVVRDTVPLDLKVGVNDVRFTDATNHLEPDSVILRDPAGRVRLQILEQNYRAVPVSQGLLLSLYEGQTIDFSVGFTDGTAAVVHGKIIRSGFFTRGNPDGSYAVNDAYSQAESGSEPIIEVDGKLRFGLPGLPLFPALADDTVLKSTLHWRIQSDQPARLDAELAYVTAGLGWHADYSLVAPEQGDQIDLVGLVTMNNQSGKVFTNAKIKLMAGDVNKEAPNSGALLAAPQGAAGLRDSASIVTEKAFDEYHLYSLPRPTTLHDRETKQVEFVHAAGVQAGRDYVYDGMRVAQRWQGYDPGSQRENADYGRESNPKVAVMREIRNTTANGLGLPLPKGRVRFYRRDADGQLEFTGENLIDHTPQDETLRIYTGDAFDLTGERRQTKFESNVNAPHGEADESVEIKLRNHKKEPVAIRVVEHLYRSTHWELVPPTGVWTKTGAQTMETRVPLQPDEEKSLAYTVHYSW